MKVEAIPVGWSLAGDGSRRFCPAHRPDPREVELLPITLQAARDAQLTCSACGEPLHRTARYR